MTEGSGGIVEAEVRGYVDRIDGTRRRDVRWKRGNEGRSMRLMGKGLHAGGMEEGVWPRPESGGPRGCGGGDRHMRLSWMDPGLDAITSGIVGDQTPDSREASPPHPEVAVAMVPHQAPRARKIPVPDGMPEVTGALPVLGYPG